VGHEAAVSKQRVLRTAEECIAKTNEVIATVEEVREKHNALSVKVADHGADLRSLHLRANTAAAWCDQNEKAIPAEIAEALSGVDEKLDNYPTKAETAACIVRLTLQDRERLDALLTMGVWARLAWLLTGRLASPHAGSALLVAPMLPWEHP